MGVGRESAVSGILEFWISGDVECAFSNSRTLDASGEPQSPGTGLSGERGIRLPGKIIFHY